MGRKTSSAIPPKLTAMRSTQFHTYAMQRAVLLTQMRFLPQAPKCFSRCCITEFPPSSALCEHVRRVTLSINAFKNHIQYITFFSRCQYFCNDFCSFFCRKLQYKAVYTHIGENRTPQGGISWQTSKLSCFRARNSQ